LAQLAEHGKSSRALLAPDDFLLEPGADVPAPRGAIGRAWCPTPMALASLRRSGVEPEPHPDAAVLRRVNHRLFAHELGGGLPDQAYVQTREQLLALVGDYTRLWLLKRPLGFAGRGQLRIIGPLTEKQMTWVDASLKRDGLLLEPLVQPTFEVSLHGFIWRDGRYELGRICAQNISERGAFRGVRLSEPGELAPNERAAFSERAETAGHALARAGYFGPFGVDGYRYTQNDTTAFCALGEINARYTLGFVTGFPRHPHDLVVD
jgi:phosphoribosylaminoimidazole carboxylase (NCAIR synthetase)